MTWANPPSGGGSLFCRRCLGRRRPSGSARLLPVGVGQAQGGKGQDQGAGAVGGQEKGKGQETVGEAEEDEGQRHDGVTDRREEGEETSLHGVGDDLLEKGRRRGVDGAQAEADGEEGEGHDLPVADDAEEDDGGGREEESSCDAAVGAGEGAEAEEEGREEGAEGQGALEEPHPEGALTEDEAHGQGDGQEDGGEEEVEGAEDGQEKGHGAVLPEIGEPLGHGPAPTRPGSGETGRRQVCSDGQDQGEGEEEGGAVEKKGPKRAEGRQGRSSQGGADDGRELEGRRIDGRRRRHVLPVGEGFEGAVGGGLEKRHEEGDGKDEKVEEGQGEPSRRQQRRQEKEKEKADDVGADHAVPAVEAVGQSSHERAEEDDGDDGHGHEQPKMKAAVGSAGADDPPGQGDGEEFVPYGGDEAPGEELAEIGEEDQRVAPSPEGGTRHERAAILSRISWAAMAHPLCLCVPPRRTEAM